MGCSSSNLEYLDLLLEKKHDYLRSSFLDNIIARMQFILKNFGSSGIFRGMARIVRTWNYTEDLDDTRSCSRLMQTHIQDGSRLMQTYTRSEVTHSQ